MDFFDDRHQAGRLLGAAVAKLGLQNVMVLAIPRGGVVVAEEVATILNAPLDLVVTRKIGAPDNPEYAIGAVTQDGEPVVDEAIIDSLGISREYVKREAARKAEEVKERIRNYRGDRPYPSFVGRSVVLVDDGIATGYTTMAAILSLRRQNPAHIVLATPIAPEETLTKLSNLVDRVVCLGTPKDFYAVGQFYRVFDQVDDAQVREILGKSWRASPP
jgi:predicted phosphoribosyltransferase